MSEIICCVYQLVRPSSDEKGKSNCKSCEPDDKNKLCKDYRPIKLQTIDTR